MILYKVRNGIIEVENVLKETKCGWRQLNGGFYNKNAMRGFIHLDETYLTTSIEEAGLWAAETRSYLSSVMQVSIASISDVDNWAENGAYEDEVPKSRFVYGAIKDN